MASSRIHKLGSIYSRVNGLIRKGHLKKSQRPLWFDVYEAFPPKYEPTFKRKLPDIEVKQIFYKEDALRAKIHRALPARLNVINLRTNEVILSQKLLKTCEKYISEGMSEDEAVEKAVLEVTEKSQEPPTEEKVDVQKLLDEILLE